MFPQAPSSSSRQRWRQAASASDLRRPDRLHLVAFHRARAPPRKSSPNRSRGLVHAGPEPRQNRLPNQTAAWPASRTARPARRADTMAWAPIRSRSSAAATRSNANTALLESPCAAADADPALLIAPATTSSVPPFKTKDGNSTQGTTLPGNNPEVPALLRRKPYTGVVKRAGQVLRLGDRADHRRKRQGRWRHRRPGGHPGDMGTGSSRSAVAEIKSGHRLRLHPRPHPRVRTIDTEFIAHPTVGQDRRRNQPGLNDIVVEQPRRKRVPDLQLEPQTGGPGRRRMVVFQTSPSGTGSSHRQLHRRNSPSDVGPPQHPHRPVPGRRAAG